MPEQAEIIKQIYRMYLEGSCILEVIRVLEADKTKTVTGKEKCILV